MMIVDISQSELILDSIHLAVNELAVVYLTYHTLSHVIHSTIIILNGLDIHIHSKILTEHIVRNVVRFNQ